MGTRPEKPQGGLEESTWINTLSSTSKGQAIIESLFLSFHFINCTDEDGGGGMKGGGGKKWSIPHPNGEGEQAGQGHSILFATLTEALGKNKERMKRRQTCWARAFTNTRAHAHTHPHLQ